MCYHENCEGTEKQNNYSIIGQTMLNENTGVVILFING